MDDDDIVWIKEESPRDVNSDSYTNTTSVAVDSLQAKDIRDNDTPSHYSTFDQQFNESDKENRNSKSSEEFDITEYEQKMHDHVKQAVDLVGDLCNRSGQISEQQRKTLLRLHQEQRERQELVEEMKKLVEENVQLSALKHQSGPCPVQFATVQKGNEVNRAKETEEEWPKVNSFFIGDNELSQPNSATSLQNTDQIVVADQDNGLLLYSIQSGFVKKVCSPKWKWPQSVTCTKDNEILVSALVKNESGEKPGWKRNLLKFDKNMEFISRIEGPKCIQDEIITKDYLCIAPNGYIYLCITGDTFSALYELATCGKWTELFHKRGEKFGSVQVLAVIDPITELLVVERRRGYIWLLSIRESNVCSRNIIASVEKPGALCIDEQHQLFIHDIGQSKIRCVETRTFEPKKDVALATKNLTSINACQGLLIAVSSINKTINIHKY